MRSTVANISMVVLCRSLNEKGLFDYLLVNDDLEACYAQLKAIALRALAGLDAEPGHVPENVVIAEVCTQPLYARSMLELGSVFGAMWPCS